MDKASEKIQPLLGRGEAHGGEGRSSSKWVIGTLAAAMVGSLVLLAVVSRQRVDGSAETKVLLASFPAKADSATPSDEARSKPVAKDVLAAPKKTPSGVMNIKGATRGKSGTTPASKSLLLKGKESEKTANWEVKMNPPIGAAGVTDEDSQVIKLRTDWFHDQPAYPNRYIPDGALQLAIQQRES